MGIGIQKITTAVPQFKIEQNHFLDQLSPILNLGEESRNRLQAVCKSCGIHYRYITIPDLNTFFSSHCSSI